MKKAKITMMFAMAAAVIGLTLVSCEKDTKEEGKKAMTIAEWVKEGVEVDMQSHVLEIPIKTKGEWTAVPDPDAIWFSLNGHELTYKGDRTLLLCIDENRTEVDRKSVLYVEDSKGEIYEIPVRQNYNFNGEAPTNGSGLNFSNNGVGFGVDYDYVLDTRGIARRNALEDAKIANGQMKESERTQFAPTKVRKNNPLFNITRIERLMEQGKLGNQAYIENPIHMDDLAAELMDSTVVQDKTLDVSLELGVSFGCIEFVAGATYSSQATEQRQKMDYTIIRNLPLYNVSVSEAEIASYAEDAMFEEMKDYEAGLAKIEAKIEAYYKQNGKSELTKVQQKIIDGMYNKLECPTFDNVFASSFGKCYWDLYAAVANEDEKAINAAMSKIDALYGPFYISGGDFGGAMTIHAVIDNLSMEGYVKAGGNLDADFAGAFKVTGSFEYSENGMTLMRDAKAHFYLYGGETDKTTDTLFNLMNSDDPTDRDAWSEAIRAWIETMYSDDGQISMASPMSFVITPIWNIFWDDETQLVAKEWFLNEYKDRGILDYFGIMNGEEISPEDIIKHAQADIN